MHSQIRIHTIDMGAKVELHDVIILQDSRVPSVGGVVSGTVVEGDTRGKRQSRLQPILPNQLAGCTLHLLTRNQTSHYIWTETRWKEHGT